MKQATWDHRFMALAKTVASWSKDPSTKVGAVIADNDARPHGYGFNGLPRGVEDTPHRLNDRETRVSLTVHAEINALLHSSGDVRGAYMYTTHAPCVQCAAAIINAGITRVVTHRPSPEFIARWGGGIELLAEAGVTIDYIG